MRAPADLHPADRQARLALRETLIRARHTLDLSQADVAARIGCSPNAISALEIGESWRTSRIQRLARGVHLRIVFRVAGIDFDSPPGVDLFRPTNPTDADKWDQAALVTDMIAARRAAGVTQTELADRLGVADRIVSRIEQHQHGMLLITPQRYCRALGGRLDITTEPANP